MIYRAAATLIVIFWLVMTTLLIRNEVEPESSGLRDLPLDHVLKVIYLHEQPSDLRIYSGSDSVGHLRIHPQVRKDTGERVFDFTGTVQITLGSEKKSRVSWSGAMVMSPTFELRSSDWSVTLHDPGYLRLEVRTEANSPTAHMKLQSKTGVIDERDVTLNEDGFTSVAQQFGATPDMLALVQRAKVQAEQAQKPVIRARQSSIRYRGERTETYLVTIEQNGQTLLECHFSQLGQVLQARDLFGHALRPDDLLP